MSGTKVTKDREARENPIIESTGAVTSDSLAAESLRHDGGFAAGNPHAAALEQSSRGSTLATTDTEAATTLPAAPDAEARDAQAEWQETSALHAARGLRDTDSTRNTARDPNSGSVGNSAVYGQDSKTDSYSGRSQTADRGAEDDSSSGFDGPNASFTTDIGAKDDPGRLAEDKFEKRNTATDAATKGGATGVPRQFESDAAPGGQYASLDKDAQA